MEYKLLYNETRRYPEKGNGEKHSTILINVTYPKRTHCFFLFGLEGHDKDGLFRLKHPHDFVRPFLSDAVRTIVSFPQSHTHFQQLNR